MKILVVEPESGLSEVLKMTFEVSGHKVMVAGDGFEALYAFDRENPDLITLELALPKVSGFRLIQLFRKSVCPDVPILVITGLELEDAQEALKLGANELITKPFSLTMLMGKVKKLQKTAKAASNVC